MEDVDEGRAVLVYQGIRGLSDQVDSHPVGLSGIERGAWVGIENQLLLFRGDECQVHTEGLGGLLVNPSGRQFDRVARAVLDPVYQEVGCTEAGLQKKIP